MGKCVVKPTRLIVFLEVVNGCNNKECPSWGTVCPPREQKFMTPKVIWDLKAKMSKVFKKSNPFEIIDIWAYGNGDTLDHPNLTEMLQLIKSELGVFGKISTAIDSRRDIPKIHKWYISLDKIKIIHKLPETFNWIERAKYWATIPVKMSHKLITNKLTSQMWQIWGNGNGFITELKAVPFHNIVLGTDNPQFTQRDRFTWEKGLPAEYGPYPGRPVRRVLITWDGKYRRCLVSPTKHKTLEDLFLGGDEICYECFPLTGSELAKFYPDKVVITPSANCVSDGYFMPPDVPIRIGISHEQ